MKLVDLLFVLLALTFFPLHDGILARTSQWPRLAEAVGLGPLQPLTWRRTLARDLGLLDRHFLAAAVVCAALVVVSLKLPVLFVWASLAGFVSFFAWVTFRWTFNERAALHQIAPVAGFSLIPGFVFLMMDYSGPKMGLFTAYAEKLWFLKYTSYTAFQIAAYASLGVAGLLVAYFLFAWLIFRPFGYLVLLCLKTSRMAATHVARLAGGHDVLFPVSVAVQAFGLVYFYVVSRHL